jgi:NitT/TauT family transport system ATP-binding protein
MGGILAPSAGRVLVAGDPPAHCLNPFTYVFQDFALLPWRSVEDNVALPLEHHKLSSAERARRVSDVLARTGLSEFRAAYPKQLSGGMRQRVGIARALAVNPAILLMDEPLSALDAQTRELLMEDFLRLLLGERLTAVYVTHNLSEALRLADRVAILSRRPGRLREIVSIDMPQTERTGTTAQANLAALHERLWGLIKAEAQVAEREVVHG